MQANSTGERIVWCVVILLGPLTIIVVAIRLATGWAMVTNVVAEPDGSRSRPHHVKIKD